MAKSLTEYLTTMQELTTRNLELLKALNDSFYTKSEHLTVDVDNTQYVIPSFLSLENKINTLQDNFENLVNAPKTGVAAFNFNGNTQEIEMKGFTNTPDAAYTDESAANIAANIKTFGQNRNDIFKDFLTPTPYIKFDLRSLPDDILQVNIKKAIIKNDELLNLLRESTISESGWDDNTVCLPIEYSEYAKKIFGRTLDYDYVEYDKIYTLPIRDKLGSGTYIIKNILSNETDANFNEHYKLKLDNLSYYVADGTIERTLAVGDYLVTNNDKCKLEIEAVDYSNNIVTVIVLNGGYADLCTEADGNVDLFTLKYFSKDDVNDFKYINVPLEEDQNVIIFIAPICKGTLIQSAWGTGIMFDVFKLKLDTDANKSFKDFYDESIINVGDKLFGLVSMAENDLVSMGQTEFNTLTYAKPILDADALHVLQINKHMSNSATIEEIYNLYAQKAEYKTELNNVQKQIDDINILLGSLSFEDTTQNRQIYTAQLDTLNERKKILTSSIADTINRITAEASNTDTPIDNPKYHIRGFFDYNNFLNTIGMGEKHGVIKICVQYRYKNANKATGNAESIGDDIFSDWNDMPSELLYRNPVYKQIKYDYVYPGDTSKQNVPSFNQIDIPITQGETVDMRIKVVYEVGFPFVRVESDWSDIINIQFPDELKKNITVLDIIKENNNDVNKEMFNGILEKKGINAHVDDRIIDQDITYYHQPEHIASGFYTEERRVIPLRDKLQSLTNDITEIRDEVLGTSASSLQISASDGINEITINPYEDNNLSVSDYTSVDTSTTNNWAVQTLTINIKNTSAHSVKLFSIFPGTINSSVTSEKPQSKYTNKDYTNDDYSVLLRVLDKNSADDDWSVWGQAQNQWVYFRINNPYNGVSYYSGDVGTSIFGINNKINGTYNWYDNDKTQIYAEQTTNNAYYVTGVDNDIKNYNSSEYGAVLYPQISSFNEICIDGNGKSNYKLINAGEAVQIPFVFAYHLNAVSQKYIEKTISFDIRTSLYEDPINYTLKVSARYTDDLASKLFKKMKKNKYSPIVIN